MQLATELWAKFAKLTQFIQTTTNHNRNGMCAINLEREGIAFAQIAWDEQKKPQLKFSDYIPISGFDPDKIHQALSALVRKNNFQYLECNWVLQTKDYELISVPNLPVPNEELPTALRWHIKDQIDFPVTDAAIDFFKVPYLSKTQKDELIYVIVARKNYLSLMAKIITEVGLNLNAIEIPEFAIRNIIELFADKNIGIGVIEVYATGVRLSIMQDGFIFLVRRIDVVLSQTQVNTEDVHILVTEIQRSCDYYENGLGQTPVAKFLLISAETVLAELLSHELSMPVEYMDLSAKFMLPDNLKSKAQHFLYAIGGALRQEEFIKHEAAN